MEQQLLEAMAKHPGASTAALANILGVGKGVVCGRCYRLGQRGLIEKTRSGNWRLTSLPARGVAYLSQTVAAERIAAEQVPPERSHQGVKSPAVVRAKEAALLEALRRSPEGLRTPQICEATGELAGAVADRLYRLLRRGEVERLGRSLWRLPRGEDSAESDDELVMVTPTPEPEPEDPTRWIRPISHYVRVENLILRMRALRIR